MNAQPSADDFKMRTGITGAIVGIEALTDAVTAGGDHHLGNQDFNGFFKIKPGADHISGGIVDDGVQDGLFKVFAVAQFGSVHKVGNP